METLISIACTLNTLCTIFQDTLNSFKQRNLDALDYTGVVQKVLKPIEEYVFPILKRLMFFEIILSIYLLLWQTIWIDLVFFSKILLVCILFLPQIIFITLVFLLELYVLVVLCFKRSFNGYLLMGMLEFVFELIVFGCLDFFLPSIFDAVSQKAFKIIKDKPQCEMNTRNQIEKNTHPGTPAQDITTQLKKGSSTN